MLEREMAKAFLSCKFEADEEAEVWILEALTSLATKQEPENEKSRVMVQELVKTLTSKEISALITLLSKERHIDGNSLDESLSSIKGMSTNFFTKNSKKGSGVFPLLFTDERSVLVNGNEKEELAVVIKGDQFLFPLVPTMDALGYKTKLGPEYTTLEMSSERNTYYFNIKNKTFIHEGQTFGLLENPFQNLNGDWYLERHWLNAIFKVRVSESDEAFILEL
ncbi:hypothetical protein JCM21738_3992 [Mesobacillus boroniphilus JCM 21738]|uniref:Copper amine oxidase-like N-terminal domain-containing protein n=1 Tax=Mesobacillus boroniphilus JCM 21738 TaxID=1294265 RepID=W4RRI5_9BACI|nr:hypothetical protein JCM21738_3992 [Mesobacillus boroniphilus JCM 21738]